MRLPASAVLSLWTVAAPAADWVDIPSPGAVMVQFDTGSIVREGDVARAWDKAVYPRDQVLGSGDVAYRSMRTLVGYHCVLRTSLPLARVFFTEDGREIARTNLEGVELSQPVVPDSPRARMLEKACAKKTPPGAADRAAARVAPAEGSALPAERRRAKPAAGTRAGAAAARPADDPKDAPVGGTAEQKTADRAVAPAGAAQEQAATKPEAGPKAGKAAQEDTAAKPGAGPDAGKAASLEAGSKGDGGSAKTGPADSGSAPAASGAKPESSASATGQSAAGAKPEGPGVARDKGGKVRWSYQGKQDGPAAWHKLDPGFELCAKGQRQSPIDIKDGVRLQLDGLKLDYRSFNLRILDTGHTVQVTVPPGSTMTLGTRTFELLQFHFHKPSEERIAGRVYDMVAHFVHKSKDGRLAVLAVLFAPGPDHPVIQSLWNHLPLEAGRDQEVPGVKVDLNALLPRNRGYFTYIGSLTTPPCTEGVQWVVLKTPVLVSRGQVSIFAKLYAMNARPLQPANGRLIKETL